MNVLKRKQSFKRILIKVHYEFCGRIKAFTNPDMTNSRNNRVGLLRDEEQGDWKNLIVLIPYSQAFLHADDLKTDLYL